MSNAVNPINKYGKKDNCHEQAYFSWLWIPNTGKNVFITSTYKLCLSVWVSMSVCLYPINVKTAGRNGPYFCVGPHLTPGRVCEWSMLKKLASNKIRFSLNSKILEFFYIVLECIQRKNLHNWKRRWSQRALNA